MNYPTKLEELVQDGGGPLVCHGCAHSLGGGTFPNGPSGERPCCFCTRNVLREKMLSEVRADGGGHFAEGVYGVTWTAFYDNSPMKKCPMDLYITVDRINNEVPEGSVAFT